MNPAGRSRHLIAMLVAGACLLGARAAGAQTITTGTLSGTVVDQQGGVLPGVTVSAVHEPTGTRYDAVTGGDGRYQIPNVRVGGPYTVTASLSGFRDEKAGNVTVNLGEDRAVDFKLALSGVAETVNVTGEKPIIDESRAGTASNVVQQALEELPTVSRDLTDFARLSPYFNQTNSNGGQSFLSVAGRNNRYNNVQIDGAVNNDLFGLSDSGTPGGQTGAQPISLDAIQELQLVVAPYDVRQGGFAGGGINAITRSGSNAYSGTAYMFGRNQGLVGKLAPQNTPSGAKTPVGTFNEKQGGFSLGGPIVHNRAFFFGNLDLARKNTPSGFSVSGTSGTAWGHEAQGQQFVDILKNQYGYDPGGLDEFSKRNNSDKVFVRGDVNLSTKHQLTVRHNYVSGVADIGTPSQFSYYMPDNFYQFEDTTNSTVAQVNSTFGTAFNEARVTYQRVRDNRTGQPGQPKFPFVQVDLPDGNNLRAGTENFSVANVLNQDIVELTDDLTWLKGTHTFTVGTHNELFKFYNLFIRDNWGNYRFNGLDNFAAGIAGGYSFSFSNTSNALQAAQFAVHQFGIYAGDQWRVASNLTLTYGFRVDIPSFPDTPGRNPVSEAFYGKRTDVAPEPKMYSPRLGFNWDLSNGGTRREQVRGGVGLFSGRTPYVWLSNQYGNTGLDFTRVSVTYNPNNKIAFVPDPDNQPRNVGGAATNEIDLVDPDYKFPSVVRGNLAYDRELGFWGLVGTGEVLFSKNVKDIKYQNLNYAITGADADGRPTYSRVVSSLSDVIFLTNTSAGNQWSVSLKVDRPFQNGFFFSGSYLYGDARSVSDGTSSQAASNWGNVYISGDVNNPPLARSNFSVGNQIKLSATIPIPLGKGFSSNASFFYTGQSGRPYVLVINGDANGDGRTTNDIVYVPANPGEVIIQNGSFEQLSTFFASDDSTKDVKGGYPARNAGRAPWTNGLDFRYAVDVPTVGRTKIEFTMDVLNLINLFDASKGWSVFPNFNSPLPVRFRGFDAATKRPIYDLSPINAATYNSFTRDDLRSRWQAQWGLRVRF